ncbi:MAG: transcriptional regulator [Desulfobacteraceae bacterium]
MKVLTLQISTKNEWNQQILNAFEGEVQPPTITFESPALLFKILSGKRWDLLQVMAGAGPMSIREAARHAKRDVKAVHGDVQRLLKAGIIDKTKDGKVEFPFDALHVDFTLNAA